MAQVQSSSTAPIPTEYGGDEVSALVLDPGYATTRAGFAGEDVPKSVIPSYYALADKSTNPLFGDNAIHTPQGGLSIHNPMSKDGTVEDWETASKLWEYAITSRLTNAKPSNPATNGLNDPENGDEMEVEMEALDENEKSLEEHPLLLTETGWNSARAREKSIQIAMEDWGCPAFWMARSGVLAAFAQGKASALVIDVGASNIAITPIHDGLLLRKGVVRSPLAGNWLSQQVRLMFASSQPPVPLTPHYLITSKSPVDAGAPASATYRTFAQPPTASFRALQEERVLTEFKESVVQIWSGPHRLSSQSPQAGISNEELLRSQPGKPFEMPDGWNQVFGVERYKVVEGMFDAKAAYSDSENPAPTAAQTLPALLRESLNAVDVDARGHMLGNVVVTGAASQLVGFLDRLNAELSAMFPGMRVKVVAPGMSIERRFGSWIGGSILGSLGTFHQMWISKKEYEDHGAGIVEKRCK